MKAATTKVAAPASVSGEVAAFSCHAQGHQPHRCSQRKQEIPEFSVTMQMDDGGGPAQEEYIALKDTGKPVSLNDLILLPRPKLLPRIPI